MPRVIITKHRMYELATDAPGVPVEEYYPDVKTWPEPMRGAKVYDTADGPVIALPAPPEPTRRPYALISPVAGGREKPQP